MENKPILNKVKQRCLVLSPTVKECIEREANKTDFYREGDKPIGKGGFGEVWKVVHKSTNKVYCIKVISKRSIIEQKMVDQMNREIEIMYKLNHPHIIKLINHFEDDDSFYLVMNFAHKGQLYTHLKRAGRFDQRTAAQFIRDTIKSLQFLHSFNPPIIHRDIKPENILLDENNRVKLADFGWSNYFDESPGQKQRTTYCGTPEYLAPEMLLKQGHNTSVDIWSIGILLFELLNGSSPFVGSSQEELFNNIRKYKIGWTRDFPPLAKSLVLNILKPNPKDRPSLEEILNHLWFEQNKPQYDVLPMPSNNPKDILESHLLSIRPENVQNQINKIIDKINNLRTTRKTLTNKILNKHNKTGFIDDTKSFNNKNKSNNSVYNLEVKLNTIILENTNLKNKIDSLNLDILKYEQKQTKDSNNIKTLENEIALNKQELNKYILLNKDRINILAEYEEKSNKLVDIQCKYKTVINVNETLKDNIKSLETNYDSLKKQYSSLLENNNDLKKKYFNLSNEKEDAINEYQKKLEILQNRIFENKNTLNTSNSTDLSSENNVNNSQVENMFELFNENITEFKKLFESKITNLNIVFNDFKEEYHIAEKSLFNSLENKYLELQDIISKFNKKFNEEIHKLSNTCELSTNINKKNSKEIWLNEIVNELQPYKSKYLNLEIKIKKYESEAILYKNKLDTIDLTCKELEKIILDKSHENDINKKQIFTLENKLSDIKNFVYSNCSNKLDEFNLYYNKY